MPLRLTPFDADPLCTGSTWEILDEDLLARLVAEILVVQHEHVLMVIDGVDVTAPPAKETVVRSVIERKLSAPANDGARYLRDGLLFQHIAWIAAAHSRQEGDLFSAPHSRVADKGQDMVVVHTGNLEVGGSAVAVTICEDKATENSRPTFRDKVLEDIREYESGSRDDELESVTLAILERHHDKAQARELIEGVFWDRARRYRVAITVGASHDSSTGRLSLFEGYEAAAQGEKRRRRGETVRIDDLRNWFDAFATKVRSALTAMIEADDV